MSADKTLLGLTRIALGKDNSFALSGNETWEDVLRLADAQGVAAIAADGISAINAVVPFQIKMEWASRVVMHEQVYKRHEELMVKLAKVYQKKDIRMMVLKGWGLSLDYPIPSHRPSGDLDIWNFGQWQEADAYIASRGIEIDNSHHHHSVFNINELMVENHYDFINIYAHRSSRRIEAKLKELAYRKQQEKLVDGVKIYLPSATFNALFLLRHTAQHFAGSEMTLRQLLDWALFMEHHHSEIEWEEYTAFLKKEKLWRFFNLLNLLAVEKLGFSKEMVPYVIETDDMLERVYADMISPEFNESVTGNAFSRIATKTRRWWHNRWKHRLCYSDSLVSSFVYGTWAKMLKPRHFLH